MEELFRPGEFYSITGTSRETLRYYTDKGLLHPAQVTEKGYALYGMQEVMQMMLMRYYRSCDMTVEEVRDLLLHEEIGGQLRNMDDTLENLEEQLRQLERKRQKLLRRRALIKESKERLGKTFFHREGKKMYLLNVEEACRAPGGRKAMQAMAAKFPGGHISLMARLEDFLARRPMPARLGYGIVHPETVEGVDPSLFHVIPAQPALVTRVRVQDPLLLRPEDLQPLYDEAERRHYTIQNGVFGHILSMERRDGQNFYYITMRVHVRL